MYSLLRALVAMAAVLMSSAPSFAQCSPQELALWKNAQIAMLEGRWLDYAAYTKQISVPCQREILSPNPNPNPYGVNQMQCRSLWDRYNQCRNEFNKRVAAGGRPLYTCVTPTCTR
jgi:hypothetical protein